MSDVQETFRKHSNESGSKISSPHTTGPKKSGKTPLIKSLFPSYAYVSLEAIEVKSAETITSSFFQGLTYWHNLEKDSPLFLVYAGMESQIRSNVSVLPWFEVTKIYDT